MTGRWSIFAWCPSSLWKGLEIVWNAFRYSILEALLFTLITISSFALLQLLRRMANVMFNVSLGNAGEILAFALYEGLITIMLIVPLKSSLTPRSLRRSHDKRYPSLFGGIRTIFLLTMFPFLLYLQFQTFYFRHFTHVGYGLLNSTKSAWELQITDSSELYSNDIYFLVSLVGLVYLSARIVTAYREFVRKRILFRYGMPSDGPEIDRHYAVYMLSLGMFELMVAILLLLFMLGLGGFLQLVFLREWLTFLVLCLTGAVLGQGTSVLEVEFFLVDYHMSVLDPLFPLMHWDARRFLFFIGLPLLSEIYFESDFHEDFGRQGNFFHFIFFAALTGTNVAWLIRCQTIFSYAVSPQVQVHPENGGRRAPFHGGIGLRIKSFLAGYFPLDLNGYLKELQERDRPTTREEQNPTGSISTGTCTSLLLLNQPNDNNNNEEVVGRGKAAVGSVANASVVNLRGSTAAVVVQTLEVTTVHLESELKARQDLDEMLKEEDRQNANEGGKNSARTDSEELGNKIEGELVHCHPPPRPPPLSSAGLSAPVPRRDFDIINELVPPLEDSVSLPRQSSPCLIKLKRSPSNLPDCEN